MAAEKPVKKTTKKTAKKTTKRATKKTTAPPSTQQNSPVSPRQMQDAISYLENHPSVDHVTLGRINAIPLSEMGEGTASGLIATARRFGFKG